MPFALALVIVFVSLFGCSRTKTRYKPGILITHRDIALYIHDALEHPDPDVRREAINRLADVRDPNEPTLRTFHLVARTDTGDAVRRAAVRALGRHGGVDSVPTLLAILAPTSAGAGRPSAGDNVRWEATRVLLEQVQRAHGGDTVNDAVRETAMRLLASDPSRDVRLLAARLLGYYPARETLSALIGALRQRDFGVLYESERSLMRLTGKTHARDPARWRSWLESTPDPFAHRGELDETLDPPTRKWWWPW